MKITGIIPLLIALSLKAHASGAGLTYQGRLMGPDGSPLSSSNVQFRLQIRTPGNENCLLYEEIQSKDMTSSNGVFALSVNDGSGTRQDSNSYTIDQIFANRGSLTFPAGYCISGSSYSPNASDGRKLQVYFNDGTFTGWEPVPSQAITFIPMAVESLQVGGYKKEQLLKIADGVPTTGTELDATAWTKLTALIAGTSAQYLKPTDPITQISGATLPAPVNGQSLRWNSALNAGAGGWENFTAGAATAVTSVSSANADISVANGTSTPTLTLNSGASGGAGDANKIAKLDAGGLIPTAMLPGMSTTQLTGGILPIARGGTNSSTALTNNQLMVSNTGAIKELGVMSDGQIVVGKTGSAPQLVAMSGDASVSNTGVVTVGKLQNQAVAATVPSLGATLKWNNTLSQWEPSVLASCNGAAQVMHYNSITDVWSCDALSANTILPTQTGNSGKVLTTDGTNTSWSVVTSSQWTTAGSDTYYSAGNVGIGTTAPGSQLQINTPAIGTIGQIIKWGQAGQTANLIEFQNNSGTILSRVDKDGKFFGDGSGLSGVTATPSGSSGQLQFNSGSSTMAADSNLFWNNSTKQLGVGTNTFGPGFGALAVNGSIAVGGFSTTGIGQNNSIAVTGNVGIAVANPVYKLDVTNPENISTGLFRMTAIGDLNGVMNANATGTLAKTTYQQNASDIFSFGFTTAGLGEVKAANNKNFHFADTAGNEWLYLKDGGNVGIGTLTPSALLDVNGTMRVSQICDSAGVNCKTISGGWGATTGLSGITSATGVGTIDNTNFAQVWNWSTANTQSPMTMTANSLTTGSLLNLTSSSASLNSVNGLLNVANTGAATTGTVARIQSNSTAGSGLTVLANGNVGVGTSTPSAQLEVVSSSATVEGLVVKGSSGQTSNLQRWDIVGSGTVAWLAANGEFTVNGAIYSPNIVSLDVSGWKGVKLNGNSRSLEFSTTGSHTTDTRILRSGASALTIDNGAAGAASLNVLGTITSNGGQTDSERYGLSSVVTGDEAVAVGKGASAGIWATALGKGASAANNNAIAIGRGSAAADTSIAIGVNTSTLYDSVVVGQAATTTGGQSVVVGNNSSSAAWGVAIGAIAAVTGNNGIAIGKSASSAGDGLAIGTGATAAASSMLIKWGGAAGTISGDSSGKVGIGTTSPSANLQVENTAGDSVIYVRSTTNGAALKLDPYPGNSTNRWNIQATGGGPNTLAFRDAWNAVDVMTLETGAGVNRIYIKSGGNVGIGTSSPQATLDINGTMHLAKNAAQPYACDVGHDGNIALTSQYTTCVCKGGSTAWVKTSDGSTACGW